jgi:superfamily II DNA or RNA helicase
MTTTKLTAYRSLFDNPPPIVNTTLEEPKRKKKGYTLRPYQLQAAGNTFVEWETVGSTLIELCTGGGKTVILAEIIRRWLDLFDSRVLVLAHRRELIDQAADKITSHTGHGCAIEMGDMRATNRESDRILVASVQTMIAGPECDRCKGEGAIPDDDGKDCSLCFGVGRLLRMHRFNPDCFGLVIVDEGHHGTARSYRNIAKWFGRNPRLKQLYVTATPKRTDGVGLKNICDSVAFRMGILEGIEEGYLVDVRQKYVMVKGLDLTTCATKKGGDFADGELQEKMRGDESIHEQVSVTINEAAGKQVLFFASGKQHARDISNAFNSYGIKSACVLDDTPGPFRSRYFAEFKSREIQILVNCGVATEGFDADCVEVIANARPTKSIALYTQIIGRGTRPLNSVANEISNCGVSFVRRQLIADSKKPSCLVLDFVGISGKHKLVSTADVLAGDALPEDVDAAVKRAKKSGETIDVRKAVREATERRIKREQAKKEEAERLRALQNGPKYQANYETREVSLFDHRARTQSQSGGATPAQVAALVGLGYSKDFAMRCSLKQAGALIGKGRAKAEGKVSKPAAEPLPFKPYSSNEVNFDEVFSLFGRD